jgi:ABC-type phosphate/phosphonate transport system substrate-binding protein
LGIAARAGAGPKDVVIHVTRLGGDSASAQPYVDRFLRYVESEAGWPPSSMKGAFFATRKEAQDYIAAAKPGIGLMDPPLFYEIRRRGRLRVILQVEGKELASERMHVVVKDPAVKDLKDLKGKRLWTTLAEYPKYLGKVVLDGRADPAAHFALKQIGQALRGVRAVLRGDCDATILDDEQLAKAKEMEGGNELRAIYSSPPLPPIPVVLFGQALPAADRDALVKAVTTMCGTPKGGAICKEMHVGRFLPADAALFSDAQKRYGK